MTLSSNDLYYLFHIQLILREATKNLQNLGFKSCIGYVCRQQILGVDLSDCYSTYSYLNAVKGDHEISLNKFFFLKIRNINVWNKSDFKFFYKVYSLLILMNYYYLLFKKLKISFCFKSIWKMNKSIAYFKNRPKSKLKHKQNQGFNNSF